VAFTGGTLTTGAIVVPEWVIVVVSPVDAGVPSRRS
jgi:hypothetical protein